MSNHLKNTITIILVAVIGLAVGMYFGETSGLYLFSQTPAEKTCQVCPVKTNGVTCPTCPTCPTVTTTKTVSQDCGERLIELGLIPETINTLSGATVKSVSGSSIIVEVNAATVDLLKTGILTKTVKVPSGVNIEEQVPKSSEEATKEFDAFQKKIDALNARAAKGEDVIEDMAKLTPPVSYTVKNIKISDLKAGDMISVTSDSDMRENDTFDAKSVTLVSRAPEQITATTDTTTFVDTSDTTTTPTTTSSE